jgi:hypothetical protein
MNFGKIFLKFQQDVHLHVTGKKYSRCISRVERGVLAKGLREGLFPKTNVAKSTLCDVISISPRLCSLGRKALKMAFGEAPPLSF